MSSLADRLRGVVGTNAAGRAFPGSPGGPARVRPTAVADAAEILGGVWRELRGQQFLVIDRTYPPGHRHGHMSVADTLPPEGRAWSRFPLLQTMPMPPRDGRMLFVDLETTGLAGGAGTYAFLIGCAWYQDGRLRIRQFFLSDFGAERVLLEAVGEVAAASGAVVTFNGKSFDLPLIETRFLLHRLQTPFAGLPHVDMLHPARRLWREDEPDDDGGDSLTTQADVGRSSDGGRPFTGRQSGGRGLVTPKPRSGEGGCRLGALEESLCGHIREGDVPGFEIPSRYFHFVRSGDARGLAAVMEHNRLDLISLAMLTARASQALEDGVSGARTSREALGMGRLYERAGMPREARAAYLRAADLSDADSRLRADAWRSYAVLSRRERRYQDAVEGWQRILELPRCPPVILREASEALAVHHEHRLRDLQAARSFALRSLSVQATASRREATRHRLARLDRKLGDIGAAAVPLF